MTNSKRFNRFTESRKADSKIHRRVVGELGQKVDAYFDPCGILEMTVVLDGREVRMRFDAEQSAKIAKRLLVDTADRGLELMAAFAEAGQGDAQESCQHGIKKLQPYDEGKSRLLTIVDEKRVSELADYLNEDQKAS